MQPLLLSVSDLLHLNELGLQEIVIDIVIAFVVVRTIRWAINEVKGMLDSYAKAKEQEHNNIKLLKELSEKTYEQQEDINVLKLALKELLADRLSEKYNHYKELEYIPEDEYEQYCDMHTVYNQLGGNHNGDRKFDESMEWPVK